MAAKSPLMEQYKSIKNEHKDAFLFYRLGDFYELFYDDAVTVSHELELTLTGKNAGPEGRVPMCGIPYHAAETYIYRLVQKGYKVAICEQLEDPKKAKGLVKRDVIRIVTPGTILLKILSPINPIITLLTFMKRIMTLTRYWRIFPQGNAGGEFGIKRRNGKHFLICCLFMHRQKQYAL